MFLVSYAENNEITVIGIAQDERSAHRMVHERIVNSVLEPWEKTLLPDDFTLDGQIKPEVARAVLRKVTETSQRELIRYRLERI